MPFFGWGFALASPITIDRKAGIDAMQQIATQGRERFRQGFWIVDLPGGHAHPRRHARASTRPAARASRIALDVPIVPVAHNAGWLWPKGVFGKRPGTVTMSIGTPIAPAGKDAQALTPRSRPGSRAKSRAWAARDRV